nr:unnamed protein product [Callosobruchus analis]
MGYGSEGISCKFQGTVSAWLQTSPSALKTFVANRVTEMQALTKNYQWEHVSIVNSGGKAPSGCWRIQKIGLLSLSPFLDEYEIMRVGGR